MRRKSSRCLEIKKLLLLFLIFVIPTASSVEITEVMYDLEGADEGYEWIEVYNNGSEIDFCEYYFFEAETHHGLSSGSCVLSAGEYAVIADAAENIDFDCNVFDSSWSSLSNTGEDLCIRDSEKNDINCMTYSSELGAGGDGNSLQLIDGQWVASEPTPGSENSYSEEEQDSEQEENEPEEEQEQENDEEDADEDDEDEEDEENQEESEEEQLREEIEEIIKIAEENITKEPKQEPLEQEPEIVYLAKSENSLKISYFIVLLISLALNTFFIINVLKRKS